MINQLKSKTSRADRDWHTLLLVTLGAITIVFLVYAWLTRSVASLENAVSDNGGASSVRFTKEEVQKAAAQITDAQARFDAHLKEPTRVADPSL